MHLETASGMSLADSKSSFAAAVAELGLSALADKFKAEGWDSYNDFAFSSSDTTGKDNTVFESEVLPKLINVEDENEKKLKPKIRRLYAQSYIIMSAAMENLATPRGIEEKVHMAAADRADRTAQLKQRMTGFSLSGHNSPSTALTDKCATILIKGAVRYIQWDKCTSRDQELLAEVEVKGLRIEVSTGALIQDLQAESVTDLSTELLWDNALRRRSCACDISGLMSYETANMWHEVLKSYLLKAPPPGYRKVGWAQLREADQELWRYVQERCENETKQLPGSPITEFEKHFKEGIFNADVRMHLQFLPSASSSSSNSSPDLIKKLENRIATLEGGNRGTTRKFSPPKNSSGGKKGGKGKGKGKRSAKGVPEAFSGLSTRTADGENICFAYNLDGCNHAVRNGRCQRGRHVCIKCKSDSHDFRRCPQK